jgi:hypothetical protein
VKGIILNKERFFFNKPKIAFLKENHTKQNGAGTMERKEEVDVQSEYDAMRQREV